MSKDFAVTPDFLQAIRCLKDDAGSFHKLRDLVQISRTVLVNIETGKRQRIRKENYYALLPFIRPFLLEELQIDSIPSTHRELLSIAKFAKFPAVLTTPRGMILAYTGDFVRFIRSWQGSTLPQVTNEYVGEDFFDFIPGKEQGLTEDRAEQSYLFGSLKHYRLADGERVFVFRSDFR